MLSSGYSIFLVCSSIRGATVLAVTMWYIWEARNGAQNNEGLLHPRRVAVKIKTYVELILLHIFNSDPGRRRESLHSVSKWTPPSVGTVFINIDAALFASSRRMGVSGAVRNHILVNAWLPAASALMGSLRRS